MDNIYIRIALHFFSYLFSITGLHFILTYFFEGNVSGVLILTVPVFVLSFPIMMKVYSRVIKLHYSKRLDISSPVESEMKNKPLQFYAFSAITLIASFYSVAQLLRNENMNIGIILGLIGIISSCFGSKYINTKIPKYFC